jgi:hypothetical protein
MPNWCSNTIELKGDKESIDEFQKFLDESNGKGWYDWNVQNWGCKWNCDAQDWELNEDGTSISFWFDSPWAPPIVLYEMISDSYNVDAHYLEEGMEFVGRFCEGYDEFYEYSDVDSLDDIPEEILEQWNLRENLMDREEMEDE